MILNVQQVKYKQHKGMLMLVSSSDFKYNWLLIKNFGSSGIVAIKNIWLIQAKKSYVLLLVLLLKSQYSNARILLLKTLMLSWTQRKISEEQVTIFVTHGLLHITFTCKTKIFRTYLKLFSRENSIRLFRNWLKKKHIKESHLLQVNLQHGKMLNC